MFGYTRDFDRTLSLMEQLRRRMDRVFEDMDQGYGYEPAASQFPRTNFYDNGTAFVLALDVPGLKEKDLNLTLANDVLTVRGARKLEAPEGYSVHRQERAPYEFSRSYALPSKVNPEKVSAELVNGVLTISLEKAPEVKPRQINVRVSS